MRDSVPGLDLADRTALTEPLFADEILERYHRVLERIAVPYKVDKRGRATRTDVPVEGINAAGGLVTTVRDFARYDAALDEAVLLSEDTLGVAWSNATGARADDAAHWSRVVRPALQGRTGRLALRPDYERLLLARRKAPVPPSDIHLVRQQRRSERPFPAQLGRRHTFNFCDPLPPPLHVGASCGRSREFSLS